MPKDKKRPKEEIKIYHGDSLHVLKKIEENSIDAIVTDPPYELGFMGKSWDNTGIANNVEMWKECFPETKTGDTKAIPYSNTEGKNVYGKQTGIKKEMKGDSGNASRFFKSIIYQAKASKSERNKGCDGLYILKDNTPKEDIDEIKHLLSI